MAVSFSMELSFHVQLLGSPPSMAVARTLEKLTPGRGVYSQLLEMRTQSWKNTCITAAEITIAGRILGPSCPPPLPASG